MRVSLARLLASALLLHVVTLAPSTWADEAEARAFFHPSEPIALVALSVGVGGFGAGSSPDPKVAGNGGIGTFAARLDLEAASPVWLSFEGRTFVGTPAEAEGDASVGYELRFYHSYAIRDRPAFDRVQLRPLVGIKVIRFADSPLVPTSADTVAARFGFDVTLNGTEASHGFNVMRMHLVGLWDVARDQGGIEFATTAGISFGPHVLGGPFIGARVGYLPSTGGYGSLDLGAAWELGTSR